MTSNDTDNELVKRVQQGDKQAFSLLVSKYQLRIRNLVSRYISDVSEREDVMQEAFIKAYRGLANFRGESAFYTWLYRIASNTAKNYLISQSRKPPRQDVDPEDAHYHDNHALRETDTPESQLMDQQLLAVIRDTLSDLPEPIREAIELREFQGLSYDEIAEVLGCPIGTVRSRIFRAREVLEVAMKSYIDGN